MSYVKILILYIQQILYKLFLNYTFILQCNTIRNVLSSLYYISIVSNKTINIVRWRRCSILLRLIQSFSDFWDFLMSLELEWRSIKFRPNYFRLFLSLFFLSLKFKNSIQKEKYIELPTLGIEQLKIVRNGTREWDWRMMTSEQGRQSRAK